MHTMSRRRLMGGAIAGALAAPTITHAETASSVRIGILSDLGGTFRDTGGFGNLVSTQLAVAGGHRDGRTTA